MPGAATPEQLARRAQTLAAHLHAENAHDVDGIVDTFAPGGKLILNGESYAGHGLIRRVHENFGFAAGGAFSDLRVDVKHRHEAGAAIILEQVLSGRHTGVWNGIPPTGKTVDVTVCTVYAFDAEGRLAEERIHFDGARLLAQLGSLPVSA
jgi:predicted ester cyclase